MATNHHLPGGDITRHLMDDLATLASRRYAAPAVAKDVQQAFQHLADAVGPPQRPLHLTADPTGWRHQLVVLVRDADAAEQLDLQVLTNLHAALTAALTERVDVDS